MAKVLVWDIPTRLFHWLFAGGFLAAFFIAFLSSEHGALFPIHMLIGLVLGLLVISRTIWGFAGTRYAQFRSFMYRPAAVVAYARDALGRGNSRHIGHSPGSSYAIFAMLALVLLTVSTGVLMQTGDEFLEEAHSALAWCTIAVAGLHVAGVMWYSIRFKENLSLSMINGMKEGGPHGGIHSARPLVGVAFALIVGLWTGGLFWNYDPAERKTELPFLGVPVHLGESDTEADDEDHSSHGDDD